MANYESSEHARGLLKAGLTANSPSCSSCHGTHEIHPKADAAASTNPANVSETCGKCHAGVLREWRDSAHGPSSQKSVEGGKRPGGLACTACHTSHAVTRQDSAAVRTQAAGRCGNCHEKVGVTFRDSFHGKATVLKDASAAACADCHTPHHNLPASDPRSSTHPDNLAKTCGACHPNANASFLTFDPHADPKDPKRNLYVFLAWLGMTGVLLSVFGFFAIHDLLWLQRSVVGKLRGEFGAAHRKTGPHFRRFTGAQIALHVTIVTSFLLLAATGLPLKFAEAPWAPGLMAVFGSREVAGVLHRLAAAVTFGYFAWHLAALAYGWLVRKERGYFWGPRSMVPQPRDVLELWAMLKYFLYIGPRPKFDRFTYWEKFDYIGVFWGVAVIGISGLFLWMPGLATKFLPGWVLNAAYVIHSDEALLATGFIFVFHFFHTHLRPESFPMDTVVFTGRVPLEAFKEERPLEYEALVAQGKLDARLAPAPTPEEMRTAYVFGFVTLAIGIVLAVFIFWGLLDSLHP
jgi:cytochrome b subunit of formate dehydrogenase